jgi:hypothetical protein
MKDRVPFTHFTNILTCLTYLADVDHYIFPANVGVLFAGSTIAQLFPKGISDKYGHSVDFIKSSDFIVHWLPFMLMSRRHRTIKNKHVFISLLIPIMYFSYDTINKKLQNPIETFKKTYPGVPVELAIALYVSGSIMSKYRNMC